MTTRRLALPIGIAALAGACLLGLQLGQSAGWVQHGARPPWLPVLRWGALFVLSWTLMTGVMMVPTALPFLRAAERLAGGIAIVGTGVGFTLAWALVGMAIWSALWLSAPLTVAAWPGQMELIAGIMLLLAALYQLSPLAKTCQQACAQPFGILARHWHGRSTLIESLTAGLDYGMRCVGCCVPMIILMLLVGMSDVLWILALTAVMSVLKHPKHGARLRLPIAALLASGGIAIATGIWRLPLHPLRVLCAV